MGHEPKANDNALIFGITPLFWIIVYKKISNLESSYSYCDVRDSYWNHGFLEKTRITVLG